MSASNKTAPNSTVTVGEAVFANAAPLALIAGPCQLESRGHAFDMAGALKELCGRLGIGLVYKTSYDKANRTSLGGKRGAGLEAALPVFAELRAQIGEDRQGRLQPGAALAAKRGAVRLVVAGLVDQSDAQLACKVLQRACHVEGMLA